MADQIVGELMVHVAHPAACCALARAHGAALLGRLKRCAPGLERAALHPLCSPVATAPRSGVADRHHGGHRHPTVDAPDPLIGGRLRLRLRERGGHVGSPLGARALAVQLAAQDGRLAAWCYPATGDGDRSDVAGVADGHEQASARAAPVLIVPLADGLAQGRSAMVPSSNERFQTQRAARRAWFVTALGRAAVKSVVLASWRPGRHRATRRYPGQPPAR
jgi:hypothetical protein